LLRRQLDLVGGVIEEVTLKTALYRMGIEWRFVAEIMDRPEYAAMYEHTPHGPVRMVGLRPAIETRHKSPKRRPLRGSPAVFPCKTTSPQGVIGGDSAETVLFGIAGNRAELADTAW
jgi:hypothetical protein